jgi:hypothetical protein
MIRVVVLALACVAAAQGFFGHMAAGLGMAGYGDHLAAVAIAWLLAPFLAGQQY